MTEEWRPIPGYEGRYEVSSQGRVRSLSRIAVTSSGNTRRIRGRVLKPAVGSHGYQSVALHQSGQRSWTVHTLVALAFIGPRPSGSEVCHSDGDPMNNAAANLRWGTRSDNVRDALKHGTHAAASKAACPQGHPYSDENTYTYRGRRSCRTCHRDACLRYEAKRRNAA